MFAYFSCFDYVGTKQSWEHCYLFGVWWSTWPCFPVCLNTRLSKSGWIELADLTQLFQFKEVHKICFPAYRRSISRQVDSSASECITGTLFLYLTSMARHLAKSSMVIAFPTLIITSISKGRAMALIVNNFPSISNGCCQVYLCSFTTFRNVF